MPQNCPDCEEVFYSEIEYREHRFYESHQRFEESILRGQEGVGRLLSHLIGEIRMMNLYHLQDRGQLSLKDAAEEYWGNILTINRFLEDMNKGQDT